LKFLLIWSTSSTTAHLWTQTGLDADWFRVWQVARTSSSLWTH
jgi:hypothetical protein